MFPYKCTTRLTPRAEIHYYIKTTFFALSEIHSINDRMFVITLITLLDCSFTFSIHLDMFEHLLSNIFTKKAIFEA